MHVVFLTALGSGKGYEDWCWWLLGFIVLARRVIVSVDWTLLLVFMKRVCWCPSTNAITGVAGVSAVGALSHTGLWLTAIGLSQVISNVPVPFSC